MFTKNLKSKLDLIVKEMILKRYLNMIYNLLYDMEAGDYDRLKASTHKIYDAPKTVSE